MSRSKYPVFVLSTVLLAVAALTALLVGLTPGEVTAEEPQPAGTGILNQPEGVTSPDYYIVRLADAPLALYEGGVNDLAATNPAALGASRLDAGSPASVAYLDYLDERQDSVIAQIENLIGGEADVLHRYQAAYNGIAVWLTPDQAQAVANLPGVVEVTRNYERSLQTYAGPEWIGADAIWDGSATGGLPGTQGEGVVVAILDSGINIDHPSFADVGADGYDHTNPLGSGNYLGHCDPADDDYDPSLVCNDKLIGLYTYPDSGASPEDANGHGTHVASTAAGNVITATINGADVPISGVAPHANIVAYRVCSGQSCQITSILAAINDVTLDASSGVSVLNYSVGAAVDSDPWQDDDSLAFLGAFAAGILPVTSNGNSGPNPNTVGSPANSPWMMSVGNGTHNGILGHDFDITGPGTVPITLTDRPALPGTGPAFTTTVTADITYSGAVDPANFEGCSAWSGTPFAGDTALISRGSCTFEDKVNNAEAAGAVAVIIFNNNAGEPPIVMGGLETTNLPSAMLGNDDGVAVRDWVVANPSATASINETVGPVTNDSFGNRMNDGSSRGPTFSSEVIKPDISAPGTSILAAYIAPDEFSLLSGTSMASPHAAGAAALLKALYPDWTPQQIRTALMTTADTDVTLFDGITEANPFERGSGFVNLRAAAEVGLVMDESQANYLAADPTTGGDSSALNIPSMQNLACTSSCVWTRVLSNPTMGTWTYDVTVDAPMGTMATVTPTNFTVASGESVTVTVTLEVMTAGLDWRFGQVTFTPAIPPAPNVGGVVPVEQHMPIAVTPWYGSYMPAIVSE